MGEDRLVVPTASPIRHPVPWLTALLLAVLAFGFPSYAAAQDEGGGTFTERLKAARDAFDAGDWAAAADGFAALERDFGQSEEAAKPLAAHRGLHAVAAVRAGRDASETDPLIEKALAEESTPAAAREVLRWARAIMFFQAEKWPEARDALIAFFREPTHDLKRRIDALILAGSTHEKETNFGEAADFFTDAAKRLREIEPELATAADLRAFRNLVEAERFDDALAIFRERSVEISSDAPDLISTQLLGVRLGAAFLDLERYHDAIICFQRIWSRDRLLRMQRERIDALTRGQAVAAADGGIEAARIAGEIESAKRELTAMEENEGFDAAVRFRMAQAWLSLGRYHEAATVLEAMLETLPPDPVVEAAALPLMQCWLQAGRWLKAEETAALYEEKFAPTDLAKHHPDILLLLATAREADARYLEGAETCASLVLRFPESPQAPIAAFKEAFLRLMGEDLETGLRLLEEFPKRHAGHPLEEDAAYWRGEALALLERHDEAREALSSFLNALEKNPEWSGESREGARFRHAFCRFAAGDYEGARPELAAFLAAHPDGIYADEARLLLGDALGGLGELEDALDSYRAIRKESARFYEDGIFKQVKILRLTEAWEEAESLLQSFLESHPQSPRVAEAVSEIGRLRQATGREREAIEIWWDAAISLGNNAEQSAVEDLFDQLGRLHRGDQALQSAYLARLAALIDEFSAKQEGNELLLCRLLWARGRFLQREDRGGFREAMTAASRLFDPKSHNPRLGVDIAEALLDAGLSTDAAELLREIRRWNPRMLEKDRLFATLLRIELMHGDPADPSRQAAALEHADRFLRESIAPPPALRATVLLEKARLLLASGDPTAIDEARNLLRDLQGDRAVPARLRAEAFLEAGKSHDATDPGSAAPYFERVYVAFGGFHDLASQAYEARARCLMRLGLRAEAREVIADWLARDWLEEHPDALETARRLEQEAR